jgi:hypothetical protein
MEQLKTYPTIGVCGLDCGLCPRYYTRGISRCPGCGGLGFSDKHPSCSFITCCVKKKGLEVCGQCPEFPCPKFKSEEEYRQVAPSSSYPPSRNVLSNLRFIGEKGIKEFMRRQEKRIGLLEIMIEGYDDGRSRSFFCRAAALLDIKILEGSLDEARKAIGAGGGGTRDGVDKAKVLRRILAGAALSEGIELTAKK